MATLGLVRGRGPGESGLPDEQMGGAGAQRRRFGDECALPVSLEELTGVQTFYEKMFLQMGLPITYLAFCIDHEGKYAYPGDAFDHDYWLQAEGPRRSFSHQPTKKV